MRKAEIDAIMVDLRPSQAGKDPIGSNRCGFTRVALQSDH